MTDSSGPSATDPHVAARHGTPQPAYVGEVLFELPGEVCDLRLSKDKSELCIQTRRMTLWRIACAMFGAGLLALVPSFFLLVLHFPMMGLAGCGVAVILVAAGLWLAYHCGSSLAIRRMPAGVHLRCGSFHRAVAQKELSHVLLLGERMDETPSDWQGALNVGLGMVAAAAGGVVTGGGEAALAVVEIVIVLKNGQHVVLRNNEQASKAARRARYLAQFAGLPCFDRRTFIDQA